MFDPEFFLFKILISRFTPRYSSIPCSSYLLSPYLTVMDTNTFRYTPSQSLSTHTYLG